MAPVSRASAALLVLLLAAVPLASMPARASTEEFSNFDVLAQEEDDESLLDHLLTRPPSEWRDEWERAPQAFRTAQGCLTSGQWFLANDLKLVSPLGTRARFGLDLNQSESDETSYDNLDLSLHFPTRYGTAGVMFRPLHDKARQDFALQWTLGSDTTSSLLEMTFTFEDLFNNLWAFRQTRVGNMSEPYERHPWEPALRAAVHHSTWRADLAGKFLTGSRKIVASDIPGTPDRRQTLWGTWAAGSVEARALGVTWEARGSNRQAGSTDQPVDLSVLDDRLFRRQWQGELAGHANWAGRWSLELRGVHAVRTQSYGLPHPPARFDAIERVVQVEAGWRATPILAARVGGLYDRITVNQAGTTGRFTYGTRNESRAYVGLTARFGRVSVSGVEGIELDPESYPVWLVHDKGFVHLQTTF